MVLPLFLIAAAVFDCREVGRFMERRRSETTYHRDFAQKLEALSEPCIVFVRYDKNLTHFYDLINNDPSLDAPVIVALDWGSRNAELLERFPGRSGYLYDESTGQLTGWSPEDPVQRAKSPTHPLPIIASSP
jgi:hypothetical protein